MRQKAFVVGHAARRSIRSSLRLLSAIRRSNFLFFKAKIVCEATIADWEKLPSALTWSAGLELDTCQPSPNQIVVTFIYYITYLLYQDHGAPAKIRSGESLSRTAAGESPSSRSARTDFARALFDSFRPEASRKRA
jgi:hypothetical protein